MSQEGEKAPEVAKEGEKRASRQRKTIERFNVEVKKEVEFKIPEGDGVKLGTLRHVEESFGKFTRNSEELKKLYHLVFGKVGKLKDLKAHLREFSGLVFQGETREEIEAEKAKCANRASKWPMILIKNTIDALGVDRSAASFESGKAPKREDLLDRLLEWLECPTESKKKTKTQRAKPKSSPKKASKSKANDDKLKKKKATSKAPAKKQAASSAPCGKPLFHASRYMLTPAKQKEQAAKDKKRTANKRKAPSKSSRSSKKHKQEVEDDEDEDEEEDKDEDEDEDEDEDMDEDEDEDEPEEEETAEPGADDDEEEATIRASVMKVLAAAGADELTVKLIRAAVAEDVGTDVAHKKGFIKEVVMATLSK